MTTMYRSLILITVFIISTSITPLHASLEDDSDKCNITLPATISLSDLYDSLWFKCPCEIMSMEFQVHNRWGVLVLQADNITSPFILETIVPDAMRSDDTTEPAIMPGVYFYTINYSVLVGDIETMHKQTGTLTIR